MILLLFGLAAFVVFPIAVVRQARGSRKQLVWVLVLFVFSWALYFLILGPTLPWISLAHYWKAAAFVVIGLVAAIPALFWFSKEGSSEGTASKATHGSEGSSSEGEHRYRRAARKKAQDFYQTVSKSKKLPDPTLAALATITALVCVIGSTILFGIWVYPNLAEQWGGGSPQGARVLFSRAGAVEAAHIGLPVVARGQISAPVKLLFTGDTFYAFEVPSNSQVLEIPKSTVDGLLLDTHRPHAVGAAIEGPGGVDLARGGERIVLDYDESIYPPSLLPGWDGKRTSAVLTAQRGDGGDDLLSVWMPAETGVRRRRLPLQLGTLDVESDGSLGRRDVPVWIAERGSAVIVTLRRDGLFRPPGAHTCVNRWNPSPLSEDVAGNPALTTRAPQGDGQDCPRLDVRPPGPLPIGPEKRSRLVVRALGDSVAAGFGYYPNGAPVSLGDIYGCRPREPLDGRCSAPDRVAFPAVFAALEGVPLRLPRFANFAVAGATPDDWLPGGQLHDRLEEIVRADPNVTLLTLGANPTLRQIVFGFAGNFCVRFRTVADCVDRRLATNRVVPGLARVYEELLRTKPGGRRGKVVVVEYPDTRPLTLVGLSRQRAAVLSSRLGGAIEAAAAIARSALPSDANRLLVVNPGPFEGHHCSADQPWILYADACIHPNAIGHRVIARRLTRILTPTG